MHKWLSFFLLLNLMTIPAPAQTTAPVSDPSAVALANQALQALTGGTAVQDITFQGSANYTIGSNQQTGAATLVARGPLESLLTLSLPAGQRKEFRNGAAGVIVGSDGAAHAMAANNCYVDADWFFPALSLAALATDPTLIVTLVGPETHNGQQVQHLTLFHYPAGQSPSMTSLVQRVSRMDLYLDATSLLPAALDFSVFARNDPAASVSIPTEIRFSAYQPFGGVSAPTRIQKYVVNSLVLDFTATSAQVNCGVADSTFTLPVVPVLPTNPGTSGGAAKQ